MPYKDPAIKKLKQNARERWRWAHDPIFRAKRQARRKIREAKPGYADKLAMQHASWLKAHPLAVASYNRKVVFSKLLKQFDLLPDQFAEAWGQDVYCRSCGSTGTKMALDHNHDTGKVRGILCFSCNLMAGLAHDSPERLRGLAAYLEYA